MGNLDLDYFAEGKKASVLTKKERSRLNSLWSLPRRLTNAEFTEMRRLERRLAAH